MAENINNLPERTQFLLYTTEDGKIKIETRLQHETLWLTINQMAELFQVDKSGISRHLKNIFESGELSPVAVVAIFATTAADGKTYQVLYWLQNSSFVTLYSKSSSFSASSHCILTTKLEPGN